MVTSLLMKLISRTVPIVLSEGFDIVVNDCVAHNGANKRIQLIDHHGCPHDDKIMSKFQGTWGMDGSVYQTVVYAHMKTFRFTGTPALYVECDIRMCHGRCPVSRPPSAFFGSVVRLSVKAFDLLDGSRYADLVRQHVASPMH